MVSCVFLLATKKAHPASLTTADWLDGLRCPVTTKHSGNRYNISVSNTLLAVKNAWLSVSVTGVI
ncbi:hypothetical protein D0Y50_12035 [Salinimonas sediminis]|uniref:Uncharacterized protein n=1 Tax=Salinimonas sediminis TaxID=2303538 RepID=A0A346NNA7_9ALTE|nr:hypothetical protein D0Y50_12035 [Salinimonas sediminis]